jgi:hypothetical protein
MFSFYLVTCSNSHTLYLYHNREINTLCDNAPALKGFSFPNIRPNMWCTTDVKNQNNMYIMLGQYLLIFCKQ